jgi:hypothetical protein
MGQEDSIQMLDIGFSRRLAESGFEHRASEGPGGRIVYRLADGSGHVSVERHEWDALLTEFTLAARAAVRQARWAFVFLFPGIFIFGMTIAQILPGGGLFIVLGIFFGPPGIYLWQSYRVKGAAKAVEEKLTFRKRVSAPPPVPFKLPRWVEIASFVLVGPHLLIEIYGTINPDAYRNTPLLGTSLDWTSAISFAILAAVIYFKVRGSDFSWRHEINWPFLGREHEEAEVPETGVRRNDVVARARRSDA